MIASFSPTDFRTAMGKFATGVTVITADGEKEIRGMTANAFLSVSLNPPLVLVSIGKKANMHRYIQQTKQFGVNILREGQESVSNHFAGKTQLNESEYAFSRYNGIPLLSDCLANIACQLWGSFEAGDHTLFVGEVIGLNMYKGKPLIFYESQYGQLGT